MELLVTVNLANVIGFVLVTLIGTLLAIITWIAKKGYDKVEAIERLLTRAMANNVETSTKVQDLDRRVTRVEDQLDDYVRSQN